jgi:Tfp pilus assembly protein PilZ
MLNIFIILIICLVIVYCSIILIKKFTYFRQQKKDPKERESEFMSKVYAEEQTTDDKMSKTKEKESNLSINGVHAVILEKIKGLSEDKLQLLLKYLDEEQIPEKRRYGRKDFIRVIDYTVGDRYYRDFIQDMSEGGLFIETSNEFSAGQKIIMSFISPDYQKPFKVHGEIIHVQTDGIGVKFKIKSQVQESVLKSYVDMIKT